MLTRDYSIIRPIKVGKRAATRFALVVLFAFNFLPSDGAAQAKKKKKGPRAALVVIDTVIKEPVRQTLPVLGRLVAEIQGNVSSRVAGALQKMEVRVGERILADQIIASLVTDRLVGLRNQEAASLKQRKAELATRRAQIATAKRTLNRQARLKKSKSAAFRVALYEDSLSALATARSQAAEARAAIERAKANLALAELNLSYSVIRAPYAGVVTRVHIQAGAYINIGAPVVALMDDKNLEIEADVPNDRLGRLRPGVTIVAKINGQNVESKLRVLIPEESTRTRTRAVRFSFKAGDNLPDLAANQSVTVMVPVGQAREIVTVHKDAVINRRGGNMVFLVKQGKAKPRNIEIGDGIGNRFAVLKGLSVGDKVVIRGNERLFPGQAVRF